MKRPIDFINNPAKIHIPMKAYAGKRTIYSSLYAEFPIQLGLVRIGDIDQIRIRDLDPLKMMGGINTQ